MRRAERRPLTEQFIRSVSAPGMYYDSGETQQLALRVKKSGAKLWVVYRRWRGKPSRRRIGTTAEYSLAEAREVCRAWCAMAARRLDPTMEAARERAATFAAVCEDLPRGGGSATSQTRATDRGGDKADAALGVGRTPHSRNHCARCHALVRAEVRRGHPTSAHHALGHAKSAGRSMRALAMG